MPAGIATSQVVIVSDNPETVDGLQAYFIGVGISTRSASSLQLPATIPLGTTAVVMFPDEFPTADVVDGLVALREDQPRLLLLLVTAHPQRFASVPPDARSASPLVLPKPAFGWAIVDAIRMHADSLSS